MQMNNTQMPQAAKNQQPQDTEQTYAVTVDGQTLELTLEQLIAAATGAFPRQRCGKAQPERRTGRTVQRLSVVSQRVSGHQCAGYPAGSVG